MRKVKASHIEDAVKELAINANVCLRKDVFQALKKAVRTENSKSAKNILNVLIENAKIAKKESLAICQDTGMAVVFCEIGENAQVVGDINKAINEGIRLGYKQGFLRKSVVSCPIIRKNTNTNTPAVIHYEFVKGNKVRLTVVPKGFGSENASRLVMLKPTSSEKDVIDFIVKTVKETGADACPPLILGIGIGGTMDKAALLATKAIIRPVGSSNPKRHLAKLEKEILKRVNRVNIGPAGLGGKTTCLGVNIVSFPTHIAGMPLCVKVSCHATRSATRTI